MSYRVGRVLRTREGEWRRSTKFTEYETADEVERNILEWINNHVGTSRNWHRVVKEAATLREELDPEPDTPNAWDRAKPWTSSTINEVRYWVDPVDEEGPA